MLLYYPGKLFSFVRLKFLFRLFEKAGKIGETFNCLKNTLKLNFYNNKYI